MGSAKMARSSSQATKIKDGKESPGTGTTVAIILAVITIIGGWGTALITNWEKIFRPAPINPALLSAPGWATDVIQYQSNPATAVARFVNDKCKPRDPSGILGVILMNADFKWTIVLWCRIDNSEKRWRG